jgi:hypothetical protein
MAGRADSTMSNGIYLKGYNYMLIFSLDYALEYTDVHRTWLVILSHTQPT